MARDLILARVPNANVTLTRSGGGVFEITVDARIGYSKKATGRFPTNEDVIRAIDARP